MRYTIFIRMIFLDRYSPCYYMKRISVKIRDIHACTNTPTVFLRMRCATHGNHQKH